MKFMIRDEDAHALDLLLDRARLGPADGARFVTAAPAPERVRGAAKVLSLLQLMPEADPPQDLVARTLRLVDEAADAPGARGGSHLFPQPAHPHA